MSQGAKYTHGNVGKLMFSTAVSMLAGTLSISGYNIADTYFVAKLGHLPLAAMGYTFPVVMFLGSIYHGLGGGANTPVAHLLGESRRHRAAMVVSSGVLLIIITGILMGLLGIATINPVFRALGATSETMPMIRSYMIYWYAGSVITGLSMACNHLLISGGAPRMAGIMMMTGMLLNVILDPLFIFTFGLGIAGAAIATALAQLISLMIVLSILHYRMHLVVHPRDISRSDLFGAWRTIANYGIPAMLGMVLNPLGMAVVTYAVARTGGDPAVAATAACNRFESIAFIFPMSLGISLLPIIAQNYGAGFYQRIDRCRQISMRFALIFLSLMSLIYTVFAPQFARIFSQDPEVIAIMVRYTRITVWGFAGIEVHRYSTFFFTGSKHPVFAAGLNMLRIIGLLMPLSLIAMYFGSLDAVFFARLIADVAAGVIGCMLAARLTHRLVGKKS